ncbi:hypothetical protein SNE40_002600 [Patella caerulea]|uniref:Uncharacterized protein n=1 Tax=Patella caerulea TaxID=87958 RepID=A0AAN8Q3C5_PATCE
MTNESGLKVNIYEDDPRWEEYKFQKLKQNSMDQGKKTKWGRKLKPRRNLIRKEGQCNVAYRGIPNKRMRFLKDFYVTLLDMQWRWATLSLFGGFLTSYFVFGFIYWLVCYTHGDFHNLGNADWVPCIEKVTSFWDCFLFSIETQSTVGYGTLYPQPTCPVTIPLVYLQMTLGFIVETVILGFMFVKFARPKYRRHTLLFSRSACISKENGALSLQIRVGDMRRTHLIQTRVQAMLVRKHISEERQVYPLYQHKLDVNANGMEDNLYLMYPVVVRHVIDENSPLWTTKPEELCLDKFEIIVVLEGTIESTGELCQARTSYSAKEILWGHRFARMEEYDERNEIWCVDFVRFDNVVPQPTPRCSPQEMEELYGRTKLQLAEKSAKKASLRRQRPRCDRISIGSVDSDFSTASEDNSDVTIQTTADVR